MQIIFLVLYTICLKKHIFGQNLSIMSIKKIHVTFGEQLRQLRENRGLTLRDVATSIEIDPSLLAKNERNQRQPTKHSIKNIAEFFCVSEKELLEELLSDQIAYKILDEEVDLNILKVAEEKVAYIKTLRNE